MELSARREERSHISSGATRNDTGYLCFIIDNFVDTAKIDAAIATGARVFLFFATYHDANNTMESELKAVADFRNYVKSKCACFDYKDSQGFELAFSEVFNQVERN